MTSGSRMSFAMATGCSFVPLALSTHGGCEVLRSRAGLYFVDVQAGSVLQTFTIALIQTYVVGCCCCNEAYKASGGLPPENWPHVKVMILLLPLSLAWIGPEERGRQLSSGLDMRRWRLCKLPTP